MAQLKFNMTELRPIIEHARDASEHRPCYEDLTRPEFLREGETIPADGFAKSEQIDMAKIPAGLWLVKDEGIYLLSNGAPAQMIEGDSCLVAYAKGYAPGSPDSWEKCRAAVGGDDFVERLPIEWFTRALDAGSRSLTLNVSSKQISVTAR